MCEHALGQPEGVAEQGNNATESGDLPTALLLFPSLQLQVEKLEMGPFEPTALIKGQDLPIFE